MNTKNVIIPALIILMLINTAVLTGDSDTPLFRYRVQENRLPYGNYVLIRSFRNVTQLLISKDWNILLLYTDRDNRKDREVAGTGFSRVDSVILNIPPLSRSEFNHIIETFLIEGDSREFSTAQSRALKFFIENVNEKNINYSKEDTEHRFRLIDENGEVFSAMNFDPFWKSISIRSAKNYRGETNLFHEVLIKETWDKNIKKIIRQYSLKLASNIKQNDN